MNHCHFICLILIFCCVWICVRECADSKPPIFLFQNKDHLLGLLFFSPPPLVFSPEHPSLLMLMWSPKAFICLLYHLQVFALAYNFNIYNTYIYMYYNTHIYLKQILQIGLKLQTLSREEYLGSATWAQPYT